MNEYVFSKTELHRILISVSIFEGNFSEKNGIGRRGPIKWSPRSPDLTLLVYFLSGYLKENVERTIPDNREVFKTRFRMEVNNLPESFRNSVHLQTCLRENRGHLQHFVY